MDFELSPEHRALQESAERYLRDHYGFESRASALRQPHGYDENHWRQFAELGWLGAALPEAVGGLGAGPQATAVLMEAFGRALVVSPYLSSVVLAASAVLAATNAAQAEQLLEPVVDGRSKLALAYAEPAARHALESVATAARLRSDGYRLDGHKCVVFHASVADLLVVSARVAGARTERLGVGLFAVPADAPGLRMRHYRTQDGGSASEVFLEGVRVPRDAVIGDPQGGYAALTEMADRAGAALCAEAVGAMSATFENTLAYLKMREQFGGPLASLQALQHAMVDAYMDCELARSMMYEALAGLGEADPRERARRVSSARYKIAGAARRVAEKGVQLHGGLGMMMEMPAGHYLKRVTMINQTLGDAPWHLARYMGRESGGEGRATGRA